MVEWLNVVGLILMTFMIISYIVLPVQQTRSHYLSVCLIVSVMFLAIGFTIPLAAQPDQCYNEITPNDMYSSTECAWSGAFIVAGGLCTASWILIRALSMNLQICWDIVPGQKFFYWSQALGWGIPAVLFTATMTFTGVSFRFGRECDVNHNDSMADFWGEMLATVGAAGILQLMTFVHCLRVYLRNLFTDKSDSSTTGSASALPSYHGSVLQNPAARLVWRRMKKVLWLQWRGIAIVTVMLVDVVFFSVVFVWLDGLRNTVENHFTRVEPWLQCLVQHPENKDACLGLVGGWLVNQPTVVAVLLLIALGGVQIFLFVARPSIFPAWLEFFRPKANQNQEFVSRDATTEVMRTNSSTSKAGLISYQQERGSLFEMQKPGKPELIAELDSKSPTQTMLSSPDEAYRSPFALQRTDSRLSGNSSLTGRGRIPQEYVDRVTSSPDMTPVVRMDAISLYRQNSDYFRQHSAVPLSPGYRAELSGVPEPRPGSSRSVTSERRYRAPVSSFSAPMNPSRNSSTRSAVAFADQRDGPPRGGLALNPPSETGESQEDLRLHLQRKGVWIS